MDFLQEFNRIMVQTDNIALATSVDNIPNVRVVNFYYNPENQGVLYIATFKESPKIFDFAQNNKVAFTTIPSQNSEQVRANGIVKKSDFTIYDLKDAFTKKLPNYEMIIANFGKMLELYEIHFTDANIVIEMDKRGKVTF